jgi:hypothetical protein
MLTLLLLLLLLSANADGPPAPRGRIEGVVVNSTHGNEPLANVEVVLRAGPDRALTPIAKTTTDIYGKFVFEDLPLDPSITYLPGADRDGVHYPGDRAQLDLKNRFVHARIVAFDAVQSPSPLIAGKHDIDISVQQNLMEISETLLVTNPSRTTYVGEHIDDKPRVTLRLTIPPNFDRVTFDREFYGRRFGIDDHHPVTDIPWPPGRRELKFMYRIPLENGAGVFHRTLDLPCSDVRIQVRGENAKHLACNLPSVKGTHPGEALFAWHGEPLPAGHTIDLRIGEPPFPWIQFARWASIAAVGALAMGTIALVRYRDRRRPANHKLADSKTSGKRTSRRAA